MGSLKKKIVSCMLAVMCVMPWLGENVCESFRVVNGSKVTLYAKVDPLALESISNISAAKNEADFLKALKFVNQDIELYPDKAIFYFLRAELYKKERLNDRKLMIDNLNKAIELNPKFARAYSLRADEYYEDGQHDEALADYNKVIELEPENMYPYRRRIDIYMRKKEYDSALADCSKVIEKAPYFRAMEYFERAKIYYIKEQYDETIQDCSRIISGDEDSDNKRRFPSEEYSFVIDSLNGESLKETKVTKIDLFTAYQPTKDACDIPAKEEYLCFNANEVILDKLLPKAYVLRGEAYLKQGKYQEALTDGQAALDEANAKAAPESMIEEAEALIDKAEKNLEEG